MTTPALQSLEQQIDVETPEQVVISYTIAGVGSRSAAALIDYAICLVLILGLVIAGSSIAATKGSAAWVVALLMLAGFTVFWGYYVLFEGLWDGQTPGKRQLGLRVVRDGGYSITFGASAVRNLLRIVDGQPGFSYGLGLLSVVLSRSGKRLGDYAAGTMVVRERAVMLPGAVATPRRARASDPTGQAAPVAATALSDEEFQLLERFMARQSALDPSRRVELAAQLAIRFHDRVPGMTGSDTAVLSSLYESEREGRARGAPGRTNTGAAREQHAIVARGSPRWQEFAALLADAQRRGLGNMSESEVSEFVSQYRELSGDLARLQTATRQSGQAGPGQQIDSVFYLSRLVAGGHNLLYHDRRLGLAEAWDYMTITVPQEIRRSVLPISIAALFMFGPAIIAYEAVVRDPSVESQLIPQGMLDRAEAGVERAKRKEGYLPIDPEMRPVMASFIITNNVQVTTAAFAGGMTAGLGTLVALVYNGVSLGSVFGLYQNKGILHLILEFVAPHGVLELTAITFGGGGGLLLGSAFLLPGAMTRREALVVRGQRALRLLAASVLLLLVAGTLEGLVSPIPSWTLAQKLAVSAMTAVLLLFYVNMGRGRSTRERIRPTKVPTVTPTAVQLGVAFLLLAGIPGVHVPGGNGVAWGQGPIIARLIPFDARRQQLTLDYIHQHYDSSIGTVRITPLMIVVHWTDTPSVDSTLRLFIPDELPASRPEIARGGPLNVSAHYLVDRDGTILSLMSDTVMARHTIGLNLIAIGIENVGGGASGPLNDRQLAADRWLVLHLLDRYPKIRYLIGHCEYGRFRHTPLWEERDSTCLTPKTDPGPEFMARLRQSVGHPELADRFVVADESNSRPVAR